MNKRTPRVFALAMLNYGLEDAETIPFLDSLKSAGYEGICLHPRDGLRVPYNSCVYWQKIDRILELARERDFAIWHYDEFPFPSGMIGGLLPTDDPSSIIRGLQFDELDLTPNRDGLIEVGRESLLALLRYRVDERGQMSDVRDATADCGAYLDTWVWGEWHNRFYTGAINVHDELHERGCADRFTRAFLSEQPLEGDERLLAVKVIPSRGRAGLPGRVDVSRPEITDRFLEEIYSRLSELSRKHGLQNTPVFQDEVAFSMTWPWNEEIEKRLLPVWGSDWKPKLAALHAPTVADWEQTRWEYRAAFQDAFEQNWFVRVRDYCHAHNLQMTGHVAGEESIVGHLQLLGDAFKNLRHFDIPGYDIISSTISNELNRSQQIGIKIVQSVAWLEGRKPTMVEVFGANGFHSDLQRQRNVLAWLGMHDFAQIFDHSAYVSTHSIRKYDAPPVSTRFNPLLAGRSDLWNWHNWFADLMQEYAFHPRTLILFPVESLARYCAPETELWRDEVSLLETWFHYAFAASLDAIFLPTHFLDQVEAREDGFHFQGQVFENFVVPPFASFHEDVWKQVNELCDHPRFSWCNTDNTATVFGSETRTEAIPATRFFQCNETELLAKKASFFDDIFQSPLRKLETDVTLLKTQRRNAQGEELIVLLNTHDEVVEVRCTQAPGEAVSQPPNEFSGSEFSNGILQMQPREVLVFRQNENVDKIAGSTLKEETTEEVLPTESRLQFCSPNFLSLQEGVLRLEGHAEKEFKPAPVSSIWKLEKVEYADSDAVYAPEYSRAPLPEPLKFVAQFTVQFTEPISNLNVLIDRDSMPSHTTVKWDDKVLSPQLEDVLDQGNTVFNVPAEILTAGAHQLLFENTLTNASQGILERPILFGSFLVGEGLALRAMLEVLVNWRGESWLQLGLPEAFGPNEYDFTFELDQLQSQKPWQLLLGQCIGVAEVSLNGEALGRSSWAPRVLFVHNWKAGENHVRVRLHGSWNNLFSNLNPTENGLRELPKLLG